MLDTIDLMEEINACEQIWMLDDTRLNLELTKAGVDPEGLAQRLCSGLGLELPMASEPPVEPRPALGGHSSPPSTLAGTARDSAPQPAPAISPAALGAGAPRLATFEIAGRVKFFDAGKGWGFFVPDDGQPDVMVHISRLHAAGYRTLYEGARIHALVYRTQRGLQVAQILSVDQSSAVHPSQIPQRTREKVHAESDWVRAIVKWYNRPQGYGFVCEGDGSPDCFVHADVLQRWGVAPLSPGQVVEVRWGRSSKGRMVAEIRYPDGLTALPPVH